jgi:hypothetical protein
VYQLRYWNQLKETKTHVIYLHLYAASSEWWDKSANIFLALTSSSSIAAWALWQKYQFFWLIIIAASQVLSAIKPFMPYKQRLKALQNLNDKIQEIALEYEKGWFDVAEGHLTEREIHDLNIELKNKALIAEKKSLKNIVLPKKSKLLQEAEAEADTYFQNNYHGG